MTRIMPADWRLPGQLLTLLPDEMEIRNQRWAESDLLAANHNRLDSFDRLAKGECHALRKSDMVQSDQMGNVGHEAVGILPAGLEWHSGMAIPALRHDRHDLSFSSRPDTTEFTALMGDLTPDLGSGPIDLALAT